MWDSYILGECIVVVHNINKDFKELHNFTQRVALVPWALIIYQQSDVRKTMQGDSN